MIKKWTLTLTAAFLASSVCCTGCSLHTRKETKDGKNEEIIAYGEGAGTQTEAKEEPETAAVEYKEKDDELAGIPVISGDYSLNDCIELPDLSAVKGEYEKEKELTYKDARIYAMLLKDAHPLPEQDDVTVEYGDKVTIDLTVVGSSDGSTEGALTDLEVPVGGGTVDPQIEKSLVGMSIGGDKEVKVKTEDGETTYRINLYSIARPDEPTETDIVRIQDELQEEARELNAYRRYSSLKQEIVGGASVKAYPEKIVRQARSRYESKYLRDNISLNDFLNQEGMTRAEFKEYEDAYAADAAKEMLVLEALCERSGITRQSEEYRTRVEEEGENPEDPDTVLYQVIFDKLFEEGQFACLTKKIN